MPRKKRKAWNKDKRVGERTPFAQNESIRLVELFEGREAWHDRALFMTAVDTMFRVSDLLRLTVDDVMTLADEINLVIQWKQKKRGKNVDPVLTPKTRAALKYWVKVSGKKGTDYLFTRSKGNDAQPICENYYSKLIKGWAELLGLDPQTYSTHSTRRTKSTYLFKRGVRVPFISKLLGHENVEVTLRYLGITQHEAQQQSLAHDLFDPTLTIDEETYTLRQTPQTSMKSFNKSLNQLERKIFAYIDQKQEESLAYIDEKFERLYTLFQLLHHDVFTAE